MVAPIRIPTFNQSVPLVDKDGRLSNEGLRRLNDAFGQIATAFNATLAIPEVQAAVATAQAAAMTAQMAASNASLAAAAAAKEAALVNSYIQPNSVVTATPATITIAAHTRYYADGTSKSVNGGTVATTGGSGAVDYVSYNDPMRLGGTVTYVVSTTQPTQGNNIHVVGAVTVPATGTQAGGRGPDRPGYVTA